MSSFEYSKFCDDQRLSIYTSAYYEPKFNWQVNWLSTQANMKFGKNIKFKKN